MFTRHKFKYQIEIYIFLATQFFECDRLRLKYLMRVLVGMMLTS